MQAPSAAANPLRHALHPDIDEALIERLVRHFYHRVRDDAVLGPVFARRIEDWEPHLATMMAFWSSVTRMTGRYKGNPVPKHKALSEVTPAHFERWLALFRESAEEVCPPGAAALFVDRAERIAQSLQLSMFGLPELRAAARPTPS